MEGNDRETQGGLTQHVKPSCVYFNKSARYIEIFPFVVPRPRRAHPATDSLIEIAATHVLHHDVTFIKDTTDKRRHSQCMKGYMNQVVVLVDLNR